jgi:DNA invertase Pin-like site-specific DNA recombinase
MKKAVIYLRTSSITNVGGDKDSDKRQRAACKRYADGNGLSTEKEFYDADVKGVQDHLDRPGFSDMIDHCFKNDISLILCENADRFSRDLMTQEKGYQDMQAAGLTVVPVSTPDLFLDDTDNPSRTMMRQFMGTIVQYEKNSLVLKLKGARKRKRQINKKLGIKTLTGQGKCEGRKSHRELDPELVKAARKQLKWSARSGKKKPTLRQAAQGLFELGYMTSTGKPFSAAQVQRIAGKR